MSRLFMLLFALIGPSLAGVGIIVVLGLGLVTLKPILVSAALGMALGVPVAWTVMRRLTQGDVA